MSVLLDEAEIGPGEVTRLFLVTPEHGLVPDGPPCLRLVQSGVWLLLLGVPTLRPAYRLLAEEFLSLRIEHVAPTSV